jgi:hypothetical protein
MILSRYSHGGTEENDENLTQDSLCPGWDLKPEPVGLSDRAVWGVGLDRLDAETVGSNPA